MTAINLDNYLQGNRAPFFKACEIKAKSVKVQISKVRETELQFSGKTLVLDFMHKNVERTLPLNVTNLKFLKQKLGADTEKWEGQSIQLVKVLVNNPKTKTEVESIRIR